MASKHQEAGETATKEVSDTYLALYGSSLIIAINGGAQGSAWCRHLRSISSRYTSSLRKVLFALCFSNLNLLLLAATTQFIGLEGVFGFELCASMLWDEAFRHVDGVCFVLARSMLGLSKADGVEFVVKRVGLRTQVAVVCKVLRRPYY